MASTGKHGTLEMNTYPCQVIITFNDLEIHNDNVIILNLRKWTNKYTRYNRYGPCFSSSVNA